MPKVRKILMSFSQRLLCAFAHRFGSVLFGLLSFRLGVLMLN